MSSTRSRSKEAGRARLPATSGWPLAHPRVALDRLLPLAGLDLLSAPGHLFHLPFRHQRCAVDCALRRYPVPIELVAAVGVGKLLPALHRGRIAWPVHFDELLLV